MTISWIEKLFHRLKPEHRSLPPERDVVPRSVLITPPKARTISSPLRMEPLRTAQRTSPAAPATPARKPEPAPDFSDSGFGLVSPLYQPSTRRETIVCTGFGIPDESTVRPVSGGGGDFGGGGAESNWSSDCGSSSDSSSRSSGD